MTSTRLPGKVLADLGGRPALDFMLARVRRAKRLDAVWVATTGNAADDPVAELCDRRDVPIFRGDEADVLSRYAGAAAAASANTVVRLTADCPMSDPTIIDQGVALFECGDYDYVSNAVIPTYPDGLDVEVFSKAALDRADREARLPFHREHVTPYMRSGSYETLPTGDFRIGHFRAPADFSHLRWTVDTQEDLDAVRRMVAHLPFDFGWLDAVALITRYPELIWLAGSGARDLRLRPARPDDCGLLLEWVNQPESLANKLQTAGPIARADHEAWFAKRLTSADASIWIAERDATPVGQIRLEQRGDALEVDIYVVPEARRRRTALAMLEFALRQANRRWPGLELRAKVKPNNQPSRRLFARAGFAEVGMGADHLEFRRAPARPGGAA